MWHAGIGVMNPGADTLLNGNPPDRWVKLPRCRVYGLGPDSAYISHPFHPRKQLPVADDNYLERRVASTGNVTGDVVVVGARSSAISILFTSCGPVVEGGGHTRQAQRAQSGQGVIEYHHQCPFSDSKSRRARSRAAGYSTGWARPEVRTDGQSRVSSLESPSTPGIRA